MPNEESISHTQAAMDNAERAGGYLQAAELALSEKDESPSLEGEQQRAQLAQAYAQMATASATLSLAQRVAANG